MFLKVHSFSFFCLECVNSFLGTFPRFFLFRFFNCLGTKIEKYSFVSKAQHVK